MRNSRHRGWPEPPGTWRLNTPRQGREQLQTAYQLAEQLLRLAQSQPESALLLLAHYELGRLLFLRGEPATAHTHHTQALAIYTPQEHRALALRYGIDPGVSSCSFLLMELWQLGYPDQAMQHSQEARILAQGLAAYLAIGIKTLQSYFLDLLAEAYGKGGHPEEGLNALAEALAVIDNTEIRYYEAEIHRLKGQLLLQPSSDNATEAASCFRQAISIAQRQQAKSWELRAATSLARLWRSQGKRDEARELLEPVYEWFTEGFDTADLKDAKALLDELS